MALTITSTSVSPAPSKVLNMAMVAFNAPIAAEIRDKLDRLKAGQGRTFTPTQEQVRIWNYMRDSSKHLIIDAGAGTGKTTTSLHGIAEIGGPGLAGIKVEGMTYHQLGRRAIVAAGCRLIGDPNKFKTKNILRSLGIERQVAEWRSVVNLTDKLVSMRKGMLLDNKEQVADKADSMGLDLSRFDEAWMWSDRVWGELLAAGPGGEIDFDDMIWQPVQFGLQLPRYDLLVVDEFQDTNAAQMELVMRASVGGRLMVVGDVRQAIYGFRGADKQAMTTAHGRLDSGVGVERLQLMVSQRCGRVIVECAQVVSPEYKAKDDAHEGVVRQIREAQLVGEAQEGDMVLCRVNADLIGWAYRFIKAGKKAVVRGREVGQYLEGLIEVMQGGDTPELMRQQIDDWYQREVRVLVAQGERAEHRLEQVGNTHECLVALHAAAIGEWDELHRVVEEGIAGSEVIEQRGTFQQLMLRVTKGMFSDDRIGITLSTVHKAKGLESKRVYIIRPDLLPMLRKGQVQPGEQEMNLLYVAITRAEQELVFVGGVPKPVADSTWWREYQEQQKLKQAADWNQWKQEKEKEGSKQDDQNDQNGEQDSSAQVGTAKGKRRQTAGRTGRAGRSAPGTGRATKVPE